MDPEETSWGLESVRATWALNSMTTEPAEVNPKAYVLTLDEPQTEGTDFLDISSLAMIVSSIRDMEAVVLQCNLMLSNLVLKQSYAQWK